MATRIQTKRGLKANLPTSGMLAGEQHFATDRATLHVALDATTTAPVVPPVDDLVALLAGGVDAANDLILIHDASAVGVKEKKITVTALGAAMGATTDEKVSVISGGAPGYLWGTDGTDGILRKADATIDYTKDAGNGFVSLAVGTLDLGTF